MSEFDKENRDYIRALSLMSIYHAKSGHPGGVLSAIDILSVLYSKVMNFNPEDAAWEGRDRFILSKGHAVPALYAIGAVHGMLPVEEMNSLRKLGSPLQGHPSVVDLPWMETSSGSLGQGASVAMGMALGLKRQGGEQHVYAMLGDGELQEGEIWECFMAAAHHKLDNLCMVLDYNKLQSDALNSEIMALEPVAEKWRAFGWHVIEIDGHDLQQIEDAFLEAKRTGGKPTGIIAHTVKGKGVSFMEGSPNWHGSVELKEQELQLALEELNITLDKML